jgi:non-ribosomal peptide synthetase component E (peptide arylation enzyme)
MISFIQRLEDLAQQNPDAIAITCDGQSITRQELLHQGYSLAVYLAETGTREGDMVTVAVPNASTAGVTLSVPSASIAGGCKKSSG